MRWIPWVLLTASLAACGRVGYDAVDDSGDASVPPVETRVLGAQTCAPGISVIEVPQGGIAAGGLVVVQFVVRGDGADATVSDSRGNDYVTLAAPGNGQLRTSVFAATIGAALAGGDEIVVNHPAGSSSSVLAIELPASALPVGVYDGGAPDYDIDVEFPPLPAGWAYCAVGIRNAAFEMNAPWVEVQTTSAVCGGGSTATSYNAAYVAPASADPATRCDGTILGGANQWNAVVATFGP